MRTAKAAIMCLLLFVSWEVLPAPAKERPTEGCKVYFIAVEHDEQTSNLNMVGLNHPQRDWYEKHGAKYAPGVCFVGDAKAKQVTVEMVDESYLKNVVGIAPLYSIAWEEHLVFVPDNNGGHNAYHASGILSIWTPSDKGGAFAPVAPIHNTNHTILSSSSVSLLKEGLKEIADRSERTQ